MKLASLVRRMRSFSTQRLNILAIEVFALAYSFLAVASPKVPMGFYKPDSQQIPPGVRAASSSVFKLFVPTGNLVSADRLIGQIPISEAIRRLESNQPNQVERRVAMDILAAELKACGDIPAQSCLVFEDIGSASGYVHDNSNTIITAFHVIEDYSHILVNQKKFQMSGSKEVYLKPVVEVLDANGNVVAKPDSVISAVFPKDDLQFSSYPFTPFDLADIHFNHPIGKPILNARTSAAPGSTVYFIGFPRETSDRKKLGFPDSDGKSLYVTIGQVLDAEQANATLGEPKDDPGLKVLLSSFYMTNADSKVGMSGGALVNANGRALGTMTDANPTNGKTEDKNLTSGTNNRVSVQDAVRLFGEIH